MRMLRNRTDFMSKKYHSLLLTATISVAIECVVMLSDTIVVGHLIGEEGISGINLVTPIFSIIAFVGLLVSMGTVYRYCAEIGQFRKEKADQLFGQGLLAALGIGVILFLITFFGENMYFQFMNPSEMVMKWARDYYKFFRFTVLLYPLYLFLAEMVYTDGDEAACNASYVAQIGGNIILSIFLCIRMGTAGASLGTLIGTILSIICVCSHFLKKKNSLHFVPYFNIKEFLNSCSFSIVDAGLYLFWAILGMALDKYVIMTYGDAYLPVLSALISIIELTMVFDGVAEALVPLYNQYHGEENDEGIKDLMKIATRSAIVEGIIFSIALIILAPLVPKLFDITKPELVHAIVVGIRIYVPSALLTSLLFLYSSYVMMKNHLAFAVSIVAIKDLGLPLILSIAISKFAGLNGIWIGFLLAPIFAFIYWVLLSIKLYGRENFPLMLEHHKKAYIYSMQVNDEEILNVRDQVMEDMEKEGVCSRSINFLGMLIEDGFQLIKEKNKGKKIYAEVSVVLGQDLTVVLKDNGAVFDMMEEDAKIVSLEQHVISSMTQMTTGRNYLLSVSFNRNSFHLPKVD